jgi:hypothetical protein
LRAPAYYGCGWRTSGGRIDAVMARAGTDGVADVIAGFIDCSAPGST